jgi:hypothetical protein
MIMLLETYICWQSACEEKILTENKDSLADESSLVAEERRFSANFIRKRCKKERVVLLELFVEDTDVINRTLNLYFCSAGQYKSVWDSADGFITVQGSAGQRRIGWDSTGQCIAA